MTAEELIAAARRLSETLPDDEKSRRVREVLTRERLQQEDRAFRLKMTPADLERTYSL